MMSAPKTWQALASRPRGARPMVMAHRGASDELPENTLSAFKLALEQGADILETDLRFTRDDRIILMHDPTVDRTTDGSGRVAEMTLAQLARLKTRRPESPTVGAEPPPTLADLLELTREGTPLALELKDPRFLCQEGAARLIELLASYDALGRTALISFNLARLRVCKRLAPLVPIGAITLGNPLPLYPTELLGPFFPLLYLNPLYCAWARRMSKLVCPLDDAPEPRLRYYRRLGVAVVLTNHPRITIRALDDIDWL